MEQPVRRAAFAGRWYPGDRTALAGAVDACLSAAGAVEGSVTALVSPHAGLIYSGAVAGHGYAAAAGQPYDVVVAVGPSHYAAFDGVAIWARGTLATPLGPLTVDDALAAHLLASPVVHEDRSVHQGEHSLELQLPFLARVFPNVPVVPLLLGRQDRQTVAALAGVLGRALVGRRPLLVASSDLSHHHDRRTASRLDQVVLDRLERFDPDGLQRDLEQYDGHACGGGAVVAVMRTARTLGARAARVLRYADSGDVSGDVDHVVGYVSAAFGDVADGDG